MTRSRFSSFAAIALIAASGLATSFADAFISAFHLATKVCRWVFELPVACVSAFAVKRMGQPPLVLAGARERIQALVHRVEQRRFFSTWRMCPSI